MGEKSTIRFRDCGFAWFIVYITLTLFTARPTIRCAYCFAVQAGLTENANSQVCESELWEKNQLYDLLFALLPQRGYQKVANHIVGILVLKSTMLIL